MAVGEAVGDELGLAVVVAFGLAVGVGVAEAFLVAAGVAADFGPVITLTLILPLKPAVAVGVPKLVESA